MAVPMPAEEVVLRIVDDEGNGIDLTGDEARSLLALTGDLDAATVSACPECRSRVLAAVALVDLLSASPPHLRGPELVDVADEAPTLHLYVEDLATSCRHPRWRDPGFAEWNEVLDDLADPD